MYEKEAKYLQREKPSSASFYFSKENEKECNYVFILSADKKIQIEHLIIFLPTHYAISSTK